MTVATKHQKQQAVRALLRAIIHIERAQNAPCVCACDIDQSAINSAKDIIYKQVQELEAE